MALATTRFGRAEALDSGVYVAPSQFEAMFVSTAHGPAELEETVAAAAGFFRGA